MSGYLFDKDGNNLGEVAGSVEFKVDALNIVAKDAEPSIETVRETRVKFTDQVSDIEIETFMTWKELRKMVRMLMEGAAE